LKLRPFGEALRIHIHVKNYTAAFSYNYLRITLAVLIGHWQTQLDWQPITSRTSQALVSQD